MEWPHCVEICTLGLGGLGFSDKVWDTKVSRLHEFTALGSLAQSSTESLPKHPLSSNP